MRLLDLTQGSVLNSFSAHADAVMGVSLFEPSPDVFATVGRDSRCVLWDARTIQATAQLSQSQERSEKRQEEKGKKKAREWQRGHIHDQ